MLLGTLGASLLGSLLSGKVMVRAGEGSATSRAKGKGAKKNPKFAVTFSSINKHRHK